MMYKRQIKEAIPEQVFFVSGNAGTVELRIAYVPDRRTGSTSLFANVDGRVLLDTDGTRVFFEDILSDFEAFEYADNLYRTHCQAKHGYSVLSWDGAHYDIVAPGLREQDALYSFAGPMSPHEMWDKITRYADEGRGAFIAADYSVVPTGRDMTQQACLGCPRCCPSHGEVDHEHPESGMWVA